MEPSKALNAHHHHPHLVLELFFSAVGVVLQLVQLLLAHAHNLSPLPLAK